MANQDPRTRQHFDDIWTPIVLAIACIGLVALLMLEWPQTFNEPATTQRSELPNTAPYAPSIPTPAPPKPQ
jgi:hypothetical protein